MVWRILLLAGVSACALGLAGAEGVASGQTAPKPVALSFATVASADHSLSTGVGLIAYLASQKREAEVVEFRVPDRFKPKITAFDFRKYHLLAVFAGDRPTSGWQLRIRDIRLQLLAPNRRQLCIRVIELDPRGGAQVLSYPFHAIRINKRGVAGQLPRRWVVRVKGGHEPLAMSRGAQPSRCR